MELRFDAKVGNKAAKIYALRESARVDFYQDGAMIDSKEYNSWHEDTNASRKPTKIALEWLDKTE